MTAWTDTRTDLERLVRRAEALSARLRSALAAVRAEAELRALDDRGLHDLGLDRGGIAHAARHGRETV